VLWQRIALLVVGAAFSGVTVMLVRKRRLRKACAVPWLAAGLVVLIFGVAPGALLMAAASHGVLVALVFLAAAVLYGWVMMSGHSEREKALAGEVALLRDEVEGLRGELKEVKQAPPAPKPKPPALRT